MMKQKKLLLPVLAALLLSTSFVAAFAESKIQDPVSAAKAAEKSAHEKVDQIKAQYGNAMTVGKTTADKATSDAAPAAGSAGDAAGSAESTPRLKKRSPLADMDRNHDDVIALEEAEQFFNEQFKSMDGNEDGFVTSEEMDTFHHARRGNWQMARDNNAEKAAPVLSDEAKATVKAMREKRQDHQFRLLDQDGDGKLTKDEFLTHTLTRHKSMDLNGDTQVTKEEIQESLAKLGEERRAKRQAAKEERARKRAEEKKSDAKSDAKSGGKAE